MKCGLLRVRWNYQMASTTKCPPRHFGVPSNSQIGDRPLLHSKRPDVGLFAGTFLQSGIKGIEGFGLGRG